MSKYYSYNGRYVSAAEYADLISDLLARGYCLHAENCDHAPSDREEQR